VAEAAAGGRPPRPINWDDMSKNQKRRGGNTEGDRAERKVMVEPQCRVKTHPALGALVGFVDSAREKNKACAVVERPIFI